MEETHASVIGRRMTVTAEVGISKIFPAGFGWQTAAYFAEGAGMEATDMSFFVSTGVGDGIGVAIGHTLYCALKKVVTGNKDMDIGKESQVGIMLGSAAVCSGGIWQVREYDKFFLLYLLVIISHVKYAEKNSQL